MLPSARETLKKEFVREIRFVEEPVSQQAKVMVKGHSNAIQHAGVAACAVAAAGLAVWSVSRWRASRRAAAADGAQVASTPCPPGVSSGPAETRAADPPPPAQPVVGDTPVDSPPPAQSATVVGADAAKAAKLLELAAKKKQSGNEALAAGRPLEALDFFEGALAALRYVVPAPESVRPGTDISDSHDVATATRVLQVRREAQKTSHRTAVAVVNAWC